VDKHLLNLEAITVESFQVGDSHSLSGPMDCTGCDSGCGIFPEEQYANG